MVSRVGQAAKQYATSIWRVKGPKALLAGEADLPRVGRQRRHKNH